MKEKAFYGLFSQGNCVGFNLSLKVIIKSVKAEKMNWKCVILCNNPTINATKSCRAQWKYKKMFHSIEL